MDIFRRKQFGNFRKDFVEVFKSLFIAHASRSIGNANTSSILAAVPGGGALLGAMILGETLSWVSISAIVILTIGLLVSVRRKKRAITLV